MNTMRKISFRRHFQEFWSEVESDLKLQSDEILDIKVILTILGYTTKDSIRSIKTKKGISMLEDEYVKRKNTTNLFEKFYGQYPSIQAIDCFPSGTVTILLHIITHLNRKVAQEDAETNKNKILTLGQKVNN